MILQRRNGAPVIISIDVKMRAFTMLYAERWKIETFYKFIKDELGFKAHQQKSCLSALRLIFPIFMSYTYLALQRYELPSFYHPVKSYYELKRNFKKLTLWLFIVWCIQKKGKA